MTDKMRDEFEAAIAEEAGQPLTAIQLSRKDDSYSTSPLIYAWWAWRQSRKAIVIELPPMPTAQRTDEEATFSGGGCDMRRKCSKAIEAAGLKVQP
ncbi:hypothetical protein [Pseudomonas fluorescens group sp. PF-69]